MVPTMARKLGIDLGTTNILAKSLLPESLTAVDKHQKERMRQDEIIRVPENNLPQYIGP